MYEQLLDPPCWELRGRADVTVALTAIYDLFDSACTLVFECSSVDADINNQLKMICDHTGNSETIICGTTMTGLRYEFRLGRQIPDDLVNICKHHATPEYCDHCFVFRSGAPILLWFDFADDQVTIRPEVERSVVTAFADRTGMTFDMINT